MIKGNMTGMFLLLATGGLLFGEVVPMKDGGDAAWRREVLPLPHELSIKQVQRLKPGEVMIKGRAGTSGLEQNSVSNVVELFKEKTGVVPEGKGFEILIGLIDDKGTLEGIKVSQAARLKEVPNRDQAYVIQPVGEKQLIVAALADRGLYYGTRTLAQWLELHLNKETAEIPLASVVDWPDLEERGFWHMPVSLVPWLASMKMNRFYRHSGFSVKDGVVIVNPERSDYEKARMFAAEVVPGTTHMDFWEARYTGYKEAFPDLIGKGESARTKMIAGAPDSTNHICPCASNPDLAKILTVVMTNLAAQKAAEVMVWTSEQTTHCECEKCVKEGQFHAEVRSALEAWQEAKKKYPDLKLSVFASVTPNIPLIHPVFPDQVIKDVVAMLPPEVTLRHTCGFDGSDGRLLDDLAARGKRISRFNVRFDSANRFMSDDIRGRMEQIVSGKYIGAWAFTPGGYANTDNFKKMFNYRLCALAEYSWNVKGRNAEEFAGAWAAKQGYADPGQFVEWFRVVNSPVGRRMTQAWGATVRQTWLARLPEDMAIADLNVGGTDTPEKNVADAQRALAATEKIGDKNFVLTARSLAAYCELEGSGYEWMLRDANKMKTGPTGRPSDKELRERFAAAVKKYIAARQAEIKGLGLPAYSEKEALNGSAPLEKAIDLFRAEPSKGRVYLQEKITGGWELPPKALLGGEYLENYKEQGYPGLVIRRKSSSVPRVRAYWKLDTLPEKEAELQVHGFDNEKEGKTEIIIKINDHEIFAGPVEFEKNKWGWRKYKVPRKNLKQGENIIVIENTTKDYKVEISGKASPEDEALAQNYNWGWCMVGAIRLTGWTQ